jgi:hypothetical protein
MALSRLENFLKSSRGKILHVNPENLDATDSITNDGSSPFVPFKTLQRALVEASRYSYQIGFNNDRFNFCTILLYPGEYLIDNRPGLIISDSGVGYLRSGATAVLNQFDLTTILDIKDESNKLYLLNSIFGGVVVPRGTSIIAQDPRKTVLRPLYVPDSRNENIERSAIFRVTGASFFWSFSIEDADPTGFCYKNYNNSKFTPNFSHHKLTAFEYVDGVNPVKIDDPFLTLNTTRTDLQQYYEKISLVYGESSGREIDNVEYTGGVSVDIQPIIDEYRIVGPRGDDIGISSITSGDGVTPSSLITVTLDGNVDGLSVDTSIQISDVNVDGYDGQFVVNAIPSSNQVQYITSEVPTVANPPVFGATLNIISDTISSSSPYIFNVLLKSVLGMCGLHADGSKVTGFKSFVLAQFTAISLQKDDDAFVIYDEESGTYLDSTVVKDLYKNTRSKYKPEFESYHVKLSNNAFAQLVSVFSIGYASQIIVESGGDYSITNSNSNFGARTFSATGFKNDAFTQDDHGFIVGVIPPEEILVNSVGVEFPQIDIGLTTSISSGAATTDRLYFYKEGSLNEPPAHYKDGFRIGARFNDRLYIQNPEQTSSKIVIPGTDSSYEKSLFVQRQNNDFQNSINDGVFTLVSAHFFESEEKVRVVSQNGHLPDGISPDSVYYIIDSTIDNTLSNAQIKLAVTKNNAINNIAVFPNKKGGKLSIVSRVSDKVPGDPGHPIQWDATNENWYITVASDDNGIYDEILNSNSNVTGRTYIERTPDNRREENKLHKILYCIPKNTRTSARPPINGFVLQESNNSTLAGSEFERYFGDDDLVSDIELRNPKFISNATWNSNLVTFFTEINHKLNVGDVVEINNVIPEEYNGEYTVLSIPGSRSITCELNTDPGLFQNDIRIRNSTLPYLKRKSTRNIFKIFRSKETQRFIRNKQDGLYELTVIHSSVKPTIEPFTSYSLSQPIQNLYPRLDRDNPNADLEQTSCFAEHDIIGNVFVDDPKNSITKEAVNKLNSDLNVGIGISSIVSNNAGTAHTIYTNTEHGLSGITGVSIVSSGTSYVTGTYYGVGAATTFSGQSASFKVVVNSSQNVSQIEIMGGGSGYSVGETISIVSGIGTTSGFIPAVIGITSVSTVANKVISVSNYIGDDVGYNDSYIISNINGPKIINVTSVGPVVGFSTNIVNYESYGYISGRRLSVSSFTYDNNTGIATATTNIPHGIKENTKIRIYGLDSSFFNRDVYVSSTRSISELQIDFGKNSVSPPTTGSGFIIPLGISPINSKNRLLYSYSDIILNSGSVLSVNASEATPFNIINAEISGLKKGDFIESNGELMRIRGNVDSQFVEVYRAQLGSERKTHPSGSVIRKINVVPVELRRNSIARASTHTFEYGGYGSGNYSTSLPENQDREIGRVEKLLSKSIKNSGGTVYYSGMDENGDFYSANRKFSSSTGEQEIYDLPVPTVVSESSSEDSLNIIDAEKVVVSGSIKVDGGENNDIISQFNGPVILDKKLTSYSEDGIEAKSLFLKGDDKVSRRYTISENTPLFSGNYGDIVFKSSPTVGENIGWVYTLQDQWRTWGYVGDLGTQIFLYSGVENGTNTLEGIVDKLKFVGDPDGFGIDVDITVDASSGFGTIVLRNPVDVINFGTNSLGLDTPKFSNRSVGSRLVLRNSLNSQNVDYSVGVSTNTFWNSIPRNDSIFSYKWFAGETEIMSLSGDGKLSVAGGINATIIGDIDGNSSTADLAFNLNRSVIAGAGLTGGGVLTSDITLNVGSGDGISVAADSISVDSTVVRTTGNQNISGIKTFTNTIEANISGSASFASNSTNSTFSGRANNLNRSVNTGSGLSGGGTLDGQNLTLSVDSSVVRTSGDQVIAGSKTFTNSIIGNITGNSGTTSDNSVVRNTGEKIVLGVTRFYDNDPIIIGNTTGEPNPLAPQSQWLMRVTGPVRGDFELYTGNATVPQWTRRVRINDLGVIFANGFQPLSDYRLKENILKLDNVLDSIKNLNVYNYNFISDPDKKVKYGFIAHEIKDIFPDIVDNEKDDYKNIGSLYEYTGTLICENIEKPQNLTWIETLNDGSRVERIRTWKKTGEEPKYQSFDLSSMLAVTLQGLKEATSRIEFLENEIKILRQEIAK